MSSRAGTSSARVRTAPAGARLRVAFACGVAAALALVAAPASAQTAGENQILYEREVYEYHRGARVDPFRSLLGSVDLGIRFEDLALRGIVHNPNPRESVAILVESSSNRRIRARVGERIGGMTVVGIHPRRVDLLVEEFGVPRRESLYLRAEPVTGTQS